MATRQNTMDSLMLQLSYLLGETEVPSSGTDGRQSFIQQSYEDAWKAYPWPFSMSDDTLTFSGGKASMPSDFLPEGHYYISNGTGSIPETDYDSRYDTTEPCFYISYDTGDYVVNLLNADDFTADLRYQYTAPDLTISGKRGPYPNPVTIATGALRYNVKADNPEADNSQEETAFSAKLQEDYAAFNRTRGRNRRARTLSDITGHATGAN